MLVTSRSFAEYQAMFDLPDPLPASVLDCCAGGAEFTAVAASRGVDAVAADPSYEVADLGEIVRGGTSDGAGIVDQHPDDFVWSWYGSRERRDQLRSEAATRFLADRAAHPERYLAAALPDLPFPDGRFELALCSHLLFTWSDQLGEAGEVRVFPLVVQGNGAPVPFLDAVRRALAEGGTESEIRRVPYEFQRAADQMLVLRQPTR